MSAGMATKVQFKPYFPTSVMDLDLNNGLYNVTYDPYHDDRNQGYNPFSMTQTMDGYSGYPKEQMKQTILKQESIFRHQLQELHRVYKRQRDLMNELRMKNHYNYSVPAEATNLNCLKSQVCSQISKEMCTQRRVIDLEQPADVEDDSFHNSSTKKAFNLADLNKPIQMEHTSFAASVNRNSDYGVMNNLQKQDSTTNSKFWYLQGIPKNFNAHNNLSKKKTIFGVEISESNCNAPFDSSQSSSRDLNTSLINHNRWIEPREKQLPHWLMKTNAKETTVYQMNLDSLQQNSQQFFKKTNNLHGITKILGVPIINCQDDPKTEKNNKSEKSNRVSELRHEIDLNLSLDEEEDLSSTPNIMEIDLEAPAAIETETNDVSMDDNHDHDHELVKSAAEAIISISSSNPPESDTLLIWFAEVITSTEEMKNSVDYIPKGMDYFEYMTLNLQEIKDHHNFHNSVMVVEKEEDVSYSKKQVTRKGQGKRGRQRKDFQRDVLPGIISLSRREVSEDLQTFEEAFNGIGVSWQSKRKAGRGRRRLVAVGPPTPPCTPPEVAVEESVSREVAAVEKSLSGWGKRTRRLPRQRCQNGGNHQSLALKC